MPDVAEIAHALTDAAIAHLAGSFRFVVGGAAFLIGAVVASLAWLCYEELRGRTTAIGSKASSVGRGFTPRLAGRKGRRTSSRRPPVDIDLTRI